MKNRKKLRYITAIFAVVLCMMALPLTAYAGGGEETPEDEPATETAVAETEDEPNPFTPAGTGTVVDTATDEDGKQFYTITTPSENVFYLIIDLERETDNVYFLNAVTEQDLLALAEVSADTGGSGESAIPDTTGEAEPDPEPEADPGPEPEQEPESGGNMGMIFIVVLVVLGGGGAAYYFKIYRPKQEQADIGEDYEDYEGEDNAPWPDDDDAPPEDDGPPWYNEDEAREDYETTGEGEDA